MDTGTPSATSLQTRINILTLQLRSRMMNIVRLTKPPEHHTITDVATEQLRMDVESTALIRAAEEIMVLTRDLKDLWLFGGLNTLHGQEKGAAHEALEQDAKVVYDFMSKMVNGRTQLGAHQASSANAVDVMEVETETT